MNCELEAKSKVPIEEFLQKRNLALEQNKEKDYFTIYKKPNP